MPLLRSTKRGCQKNTDYFPVVTYFMDRDRLGGVPYEAKKEKKKVKMKFYPKGENSKNPDSVVFTMLLDETDKEKILKFFK